MRYLTVNELLEVSGATMINLNIVGNDIMFDIKNTVDAKDVLYFNGLFFRTDGCYKSGGFKSENMISQGEIYGGYKITFTKNGSTTYKLSPIN